MPPLFIVFTSHPASYEPEPLGRIAFIRVWHDKALVYSDGPEHGQGGWGKLRLHRDLRHDIGLDGDRAAVPLERHVAVGHQHSHEHREHAYGLPDSEHSKSGKLRT